MAYERKPGDITIFKNKFKDSDKHPDYKGDGLGLDGNTIDIALWVKKDKNGDSFFSGRIHDGYKKIAPPEAPTVAPPEDDDLPF